MITNPVIGYVKHPWDHKPGTAVAARWTPCLATVSFDELRQALDQVMSGAVLRHRLGFRHTIAWTSPG